jgi:putative DNA primase/helicase
MISEIKERITVLDLAYEYGYRKGRNAARYRGGDNPSTLMINENDFYDFKTTDHGDVINFYSVINGVDNRTAIKELAQKLGIEVKQAEIPNHNNRAKYYHEALKPEHREYLHKRGITDQTIDELLIGYCENDRGWKNRIVIPYWKNGNVVYFVARALDNSNSKYKKLKKDQYCEHVIWGLNSLIRDSEDLIIAEGAFDAISAYQEGYKVVSPITGRFSKDQISDLIRILKNHKGSITICLDYDPISKTGQKASWELAFILYQNHIDCNVVNFYGDHKKVDLNDLYAQGKSIPEILEDSVEFIEMYIKNALKEKNDKALYKLARERDLTKYKDLFEADKFKQINKAPPEKILVDELLYKYTLMYHDSLGWYEYDKKGVWIKQPDGAIKKYITELLGRFLKGSLLNAVFTAAKGKCHTSNDLNAEVNYMNFRNGMLDLKRQRLNSHDKQYFSTVQCEYEYDSKATCERWEQFIDEITDHDKSRAYMLQEMFGYCFLNSTKYQKMFFLIGEGANGKSVLLKILEQLLGNENVSHVPLAGLSDDFQRMLLYKKKVNMITELKSRIEEVNQTLKAIVDGETIQGAYKYMPHTTFKPTCKIICAGNEMFTSDDVSHGFKRRIIFCEFPVRFDKEKRDIQLKDKLEKELPGIFNWSLRGLERLQENGEFTETVDQEEMMNIFSSLSDTSYEFLEDLVVDFNFISRSNLYTKYQNYCTDNGAHAMSARKFYGKVRKDKRFNEHKKEGVRGFQTAPKKCPENNISFFER